MDVRLSRDGGGTLDPGSNLLLLVPSNDLDVEWCLDRLSPRVLPSNVLFVSVRCSAEEIVDEWRRYIGGVPNNFAIVSPDESTPSRSDRSATTECDGIPVTRTPLTDLTGIGSTVSDYLERWADDGPTTIWFDSITDVVETSGLEITFRFCHLLTTRVRRAGAIAYYHMDPPTNNGHTVAALTPLFDDVLE